MTPEQVFELIKSGDENGVMEAAAADPSLARSKINGVSLILLAIYYGHQTIAQRLIDAAGGEINLFEAAASGNVPRLQACIEQNPNGVDVFSADGFTALGYAAFFGHLESVELLLESGADPNLKSNNKESVPPLNSAVANGSEAIVERLLQAGADPNSVQAGGYTPLHGAAFEGKIAIAQLLLEHGAVPQLRDDAGQLARELAEDRGHIEFARICPG